jgi:alanine racemase
MAYITLNKKYFFNNLDIIAQRSKGKDKIALVLKDNAYGHGLLQIATMAREYGIKKAVVRSFEEAEVIEAYFEYILVLADTPKVASTKIRYTINDLSAIGDFAQGSKVELKVNTGMNRNGIEVDEVERAFELIAQQGLILEAIFTHHSCADEDCLVFEEQNRIFDKLKKRIEILEKEYNLQNIAFHSCNSAALFETENFNEDMVRVGIAAYGCLELAHNEDVSKLRPILSLYAKKNSQRHVKAGGCIGYGASHKIKEPCIVTNYDFGYGDGFLRACSNAYVTPEGVELLGRISMDNSSFLSDKQELLIFNDARVVAKAANTISYEILTSLKPHLERKILD